MSYSDEPTRDRTRPRRTSLSTMMAFLLGVPLGLGILIGVDQTSLRDTIVGRYLTHPVEWASVILFTCSLAALLTKFMSYGNEQLAFRADLIPAWDGQARPVEDAAILLDEVRQKSSRVQNSALGRRVVNVLDFVASRKSANDLDDHLRGLADNDDMANEGSYSLIRFITWAIPILGFLGTVLGITDAIAGVDPEKLEKDLTQVTGGLATAFDTTALALGLTMITMFCTFIMERLEQGLLEKVNTYADDELAHRFERTGPDSGEFIEALRKNTDALLQTTERLIERQVNLWSLSLQEAQRHWQDTGHLQQSKIATGLEDVLQRTVDMHGKRLAQQERLSLQSAAGVMDQLQKLTAALSENVQQQQATLAEIVDRVGEQTQMLALLTQNGSHLLQLQEVMQQNLQALAGAGSFEQAVGSLTAAIHLLTTRAQPMPGISRNPGAAA